MTNRPEVIFVDFEGVITPAKPTQEYLNSPVWLRLKERKRLVEEYRRANGLIPLDHPTVHKPSDNLFENHTELTAVMNMLHPQPYRLNTFDISQYDESLKETVSTAREIIQKSVDYYLDLVRGKPTLTYKTNPNIDNFLFDLKKELNVPFFGISGNPKEVLEDKLKRTGIHELFLLDGVFPDWPIYGESIFSRYQAFEIVQTKMGTLFDDTLYLEDRESDLTAGWYDVLEQIRFLHFGKNPLEDSWLHLRGDSVAPTTMSYLRHLDSNKRLLCIPNGVESEADYKKAMEFALNTPPSWRERSVY